MRHSAALCLFRPELTPIHTFLSAVKPRKGSSRPQATETPTGLRLMKEQRNLVPEPNLKECWSGMKKFSKYYLGNTHCSYSIDNSFPNIGISSAQKTQKKCNKSVLILDGSKMFSEFRISRRLFTPNDSSHAFAGCVLPLALRIRKMWLSSRHEARVSLSCPVSASGPHQKTAMAKICASLFMRDYFRKHKCYGKTRGIGSFLMLTEDDQPTNFIDMKKNEPLQAPNSNILVTAATFTKSGPFFMSQFANCVKSNLKFKIHKFIKIALNNPDLAKLLATKPKVNFQFSIPLTAKSKPMQSLWTVKPSKGFFSICLPKQFVFSIPVKAKTMGFRPLRMNIN